MRIEHESANFEWLYDSRMGVGRFRRKADGALAFLETGTDCQNTRRDLQRTKQKCESPRYPAGAPPFADLLDSLATEYSFYAMESENA